MSEENKPQIVQHWPIPSHSTPGVTYDVTEWDNGRFTCECRGFIQGKQQRGKTIWERECSHTREAVVKKQAQAQPVAAPMPARG
jgi:hypothetical protein